MKFNLSILFILLLFISACKEKDKTTLKPGIDSDIISCDLSFLPEIRKSGAVFKNSDGQTEDMLSTLKNEGVNTVRLRIWNHPVSEHSGWNEVKEFAEEIKSKGMKVWLTVHYSDTWADPGAQAKPDAWKNLSYTLLKESVYAFTKKIITEINPDFIQIGNEINNGFLWPEGNISNLNKMVELVNTGIKAVRENSPYTKIMIHYAGQQGASNFYENFSHSDYDIIALSYYPIWHGKNTDSLQAQLGKLSSHFNKEIIIAETSYPFSFSFNDYTNNVIGDSSQILTEYPATPEGQRDYLLKIKDIILKTPNGIGFCYWGGEWISFKGNTAKDGSSWENQALWDFNNRALPVMKAFNR